MTEIHEDLTFSLQSLGQQRLAQSEKSHRDLRLLGLTLLATKISLENTFRKVKIVPKKTLVHKFLAPSGAQGAMLCKRSNLGFQPAKYVLRHLNYLLRHLYNFEFITDYCLF